MEPRTRPGLAMLLAIAVAVPSVAETSELIITKQPGTMYLPESVMQHDRLVEKHAKTLGLGDLKVKWVLLTSGGPAADALLSGQVHIVCSGSTNLLLLWDRTGGKIKGIASGASTPLILLTRNPSIRTVKDFSERDKIALPTVKVSTQALFLQMAAEKEFGPSGRHKLDAYTVALGHADAAIAISDPKGAINSHFSGPPYQEKELRLPGVYVVLRSDIVFGGPHSNTTFFTTEKFHDANPKTLTAFRAALEEADALIHNDKAAAAQKYLDITHEKYSVAELASIIGKPGNIYSPVPFGTMKFADFMFKEGVMKRMPRSWKDVYFPEAYNLSGN